MKVYHIFHNGTADEHKESKYKESIHESHNKERAKDVKEGIIHFLENEVKEYIAKHGYHFSSSLAEFASRQMKNAEEMEEMEKGKTNVTHTIFTAEKVKAQLAFLGLKISPEETGTNTLGDITYAANMAHADFYPELLDKDGCIKFGYMMAKDPDGYEGMIFKRWCVDMMEKHLNIDWTKYI